MTDWDLLSKTKQSLTTNNPAKKVQQALGTFLTEKIRGQPGRTETPSSSSPTNLNYPLHIFFTLLQGKCFIDKAPPGLVITPRAEWDLKLVSLTSCLDSPFPWQTLSVPENRPVSPIMCKTGQEEPLGTCWAHWGGCTETLGGVCSTRSPLTWVHSELCPLLSGYTAGPRLTSLKQYPCFLQADTPAQPCTQQQSCPWCLHTPGVPMGHRPLSPQRWLGRAALHHDPHGASSSLPWACCMGIGAAREIWRLQPDALRKTEVQNQFPLKHSSSGSPAQSWKGRHYTCLSMKALVSLPAPWALWYTRVGALSQWVREQTPHLYMKTDLAFPWLLPGLVHPRGRVLDPSARHTGLSSISVPWYKRREWRPRGSSRTARHYDCPCHLLGSHDKAAACRPSPCQLNCCLGQPTPTGPNPFCALPLWTG